MIVRFRPVRTSSGRSQSNNGTEIFHERVHALRRTGQPLCARRGFGSRGERRRLPSGRNWSRRPQIAVPSQATAVRPDAGIRSRRVRALRDAGDPAVSGPHHPATFAYAPRPPRRGAHEPALRHHRLVRHAEHQHRHHIPAAGRTPVRTSRGREQGRGMHPAGQSLHRRDRPPARRSAVPGGRRDLNRRPAAGSAPSVFRANAGKCSNPGTPRDARCVDRPDECASLPSEHDPRQTRSKSSCLI